MNRKWFWVGVPLVAVLAVAASVLLRDRSAPLPEDEGTPAQRIEDVLAAPDTPALPAAPPSGSTLEDVSDFARLQRLQALRELAAAAAIAAAGDLTTSSLTGDGLGYLDVHAIINRNDPSSIVAFLLAHSDETGADESLEIEIAGISEYPTSKSVIINQLIDGKRQLHGSGDITFDPATGAVISAYVSLVIPDPALAASVVILQDEAVAIARAFVTSAVLEEKTVAIESDSGRVGVRPRLRPGFALDIYSVTPKELRYALDPETNKTRFEWPVWISADLGDFTPGFSWEVLVDASTGEIAGIRNLVATRRRGMLRSHLPRIRRQVDDQPGTGPHHPLAGHRHVACCRHSVRERNDRLHQRGRFRLHRRGPRERLRELHGIVDT